MENMETIKTWTVDDVCNVFGQCRLDDLCENVRNEEVDGEALSYLWENNGLSELGVSALQATRLIKKLKTFTTPKEGEAPKGGPEAETKPQSEVQVEGGVGEKIDQGTKNETDKAVADANAQQKLELDNKKEAENNSKRTAEIEAKTDADADAARGKSGDGAKHEVEEITTQALDGKGEQMAAKATASVTATEAEKWAEDDEMNTKIMAYVEPLDYGGQSTGYESAVCKLLHARADPNLPDQAGGMPLANAVSAGSHSVVALLLQSRVDPDIGLEYAKRSDDLMIELLTNPLEHFDLDSVYNCYHNTPQWREARNLLFWARDRLQVEAAIAQTTRDTALERAEEAHSAQMVAEANEKRARDARSTEKFKKGTKVRLSKKGGQAPSGYDWSDDAIMPGDVGEVLVCRVLDGVVDVFVKGPRGRTCSYDADQLEVVLH